MDDCQIPVMQASPGLFMGSSCQSLIVRHFSEWPIEKYFYFNEDAKSDAGYSLCSGIRTINRVPCGSAFLACTLPFIASIKRLTM